MAFTFRRGKEHLLICFLKKKWEDNKVIIIWKVCYFCKFVLQSLAFDFITEHKPFTLTFHNASANWIYHSKLY